jgi:hypothetical protein
MPAVLIVAFARPANLLQILSVLEPLEFEIYLFVDTSQGKHEALNAETVKIAREIESDDRIRVRVSTSNLGVGKAVPAGIRWAFEHVDELFILEDDCIPSLEFFEYATRFSKHLNAKIRMISGTNLIPVSKRTTSLGTSSFSSYPSIWGWFTNAESWKYLSKYTEHLPSPFTILGCFFRRPSKILSVSFFYAASIRVYRQETSAWDCQVALAMLIHDYVSILPSRNMIQNIGADSVSSHDMKVNNPNSNVVANFQFLAAQAENQLDADKKFQNDRLLEREVYKIRIRHILSPLKSWI